MDFEWNTQQLALHHRLREIGERCTCTGTLERDGAEEFRRSTWQRLADEGVMGLPVPKNHGGLGHDPLTCCFALEGLGYGCRDMGLLVSVGAHMWAVELPLMKFGTAQQQERYLPSLASGSFIGAHAITESSAGSDALSLQTVASRKGAKYVLNGRKRFITNASVADVFLVYATINPRLGFTGVTAFVLDRHQRGLHIVKEEEKIGLRTSPWAQVVFDECIVDESQLLGVEKQGSRILSTVMAWERVLLLAPALGAMHQQIEECIKHAKNRRQFGSRIGTFQAVSNRIVDMQVGLENARLTSYRAAWELANGNGSIFSEIAKLQVSEAAVAIFQNAMQMLGGYGYTVSAGIDRRLRDALGMRISSGTSDIQKVVIATRLGLR